jgi:hypothetical protein
MIGRISDFIFGKDGNIYAVREVSHLVGPSSISSQYPSVASSSTIHAGRSCFQAPAGQLLENFPSISATHSADVVASSRPLLPVRNRCRVPANTPHRAQG